MTLDYGSDKTEIPAGRFRGWLDIAKSKFHDWRQRYGKVNEHNAWVPRVAVVERFIRTLKQECTRRLASVPLLRRSFRHELALFIGWYNAERPRETLDGATPDERYFGLRPTCTMPRFEPRSAWPRGSPCAAPQTLVKGQPGVELQVNLQCVGHRRHLPRVTITLPDNFVAPPFSPRSSSAPTCPSAFSCAEIVRLSVPDH